MIKLGIVDDETSARETIKSLLAQTEIKYTIVGEASSISEATSLLQNKEVDLIFLDIQLQDGTGFDVINQTSDFNTDIIFVTAHDKYAVQAFQLAAFGYLLKPIQLSELEKVLNRYNSQKEVELGKRTKVLVENLESKVKKLIVSNIGGFKVIPLDDIMYIQAEVNYSNIHLKTGEKLLTSKTLKEYNTILDGMGFMRIHQSYLVNLTYIKEYVKGDGGYVIINKETSLPVSRRQKKEFINKFF